MATGVKFNTIYLILLPKVSSNLSFSAIETEWVVSECCSVKMTPVLVLLLTSLPLGSHGLSQTVKHTQTHTHTHTSNMNPTLSTHHRIRLAAGLRDTCRHSQAEAGGVALELQSCGNAVNGSISDCTHAQAFPRAFDFSARFWG